MRIAFLISVVGRVKRGGESASLGLVSYLERHFDVQVFSGGDFPSRNTINLGFPEWPVYEKIFGLLPEFIRNKVLFRLHLTPLHLRNLFFCLRAYRLIRKNPPDVLVLRSTGPMGMKVGRRMRKKFGTPVVTIDGGWKLGERETNRYHPNVHIAVNIEVSEYLRSELPEVETVFLPNGLTTGDYSAEQGRAALNLPRPVVLGCGSLEDFKRFELTIKAMAALGKGSLVLLGDGPLADELSRLGGDLLGGRFSLGKADYHDMAKYYHAADVVTVPSIHESFGMVYVEAMACGKPVVATRDRSREAIVGDGGLLVDPADIRAYAEALRYCMENSFGDKPQRQAAKFDWENIGPFYADVLRKAGNGLFNKKRYPVFRAGYFRKPT
jgi:glycosyltransferase involved in cell wall biosynthesis